MLPMINVVDYYSKQAMGLASIDISADGTTYEVRMKQFDPNTGTPVADLIIPVTLADAEQSLTDTQTEVSQIQQFINDLQNLGALPNG